MRKRNSVFLSEVIVLVHILQSLWNKHVFGLVIIYFAPGFFQWLRVFFSLWDWDKIIWSLPTTVYFEEYAVFRWLFCEKVEDSVFLVRSLFRGQPQVLLPEIRWLWLCTRKHSSVSIGDLSELALVNTQNTAQELTHHFFPVQTITCPCFPGPLSLWVWHTKAWTFPWYCGWRKGKVFKNMKASSVWIGNWRRESSFIPLKDYISKIRQKKKINNGTLLSFLLPSILHCNSWELT